MNTYSQRWIDLFLRPTDDAQTARETAFLQRQLPRERFTHVLDVCCGLGRHAAALARVGYQVTGVDVDEKLIVDSRKLHPEVRFIAGDMRELPRIGEAFGESFDAVMCLWQSFGHFDSATNAQIIADIACILPPRGRFVLDIYHRGFFEKFQGTREYDRGGVHVVESKHMTGDRLTVQLSYDGKPTDTFDWQLFTPGQIEALCKARELSCVFSCSNFDENAPPSPDAPRMQLVFEKA